MKSLHCLKVLYKCGIQSLPRTCHRFSICLPTTVTRTVTTCRYKSDNFHPYDPRLYYDEEQECESHEENTRTTYADLKPLSINNDLVKLLAVSLSQNEDGNTWNRNPTNYIPHRKSDDLWNTTPWHSIVTRSYSTNSEKQKQDEQRDTETSTSKPKDDATSTSDDPEADMHTKTKREQLKIIFTQYGSIGVAFHIAMSLCSLGFFYLLVSSGIDIVALMSKIGIEVSDLLSGASTFAIAYTVHKIIMPVRISITVVSVPMLVRYLRRIGLFKK